MNSRPAYPTQPEPGNDPLCAQGGAHICGTTGCHEETDGGYYCLECAAAYAELAEDLGMAYGCGYNSRGNSMTDSLKDLQKEIVQEQIQQTRPVPGFEQVRYAGNELMGFWPCNSNGTYIRSGNGDPIHFGCMAHLRMWAYKWLK